MKILSAEQIRQWDEYTIHHDNISSIDLMERAAGKCTEWLTTHFKQLTAVKIFCGKGNNGGDGLAIARQLSAQGVAADVYILEFGNAGTADFQYNLNRLHECKVDIHFIQEKSFLPEISKGEIVIDALLGTGLKRPLTGLFADTVEHINKSGAYVVAIDLPTGIFSNKSAKENTVLRADITLTFQLLKLAMLLPENEANFGSIHVLNIGLNEAYLQKVTTICQLTDKEIIQKIYKPRKSFSHKGTYGHTLVIAGEAGKVGAAVLCTQACLRSGSGLVTSAVPEAWMHVLQTVAPEAMTTPQEQLASLLLANYAAVAIGPGIGTGAAGTILLQTVLAHYTRPMVADADALNILAAHPSALSELPPGSIITPHPKEFERLFGPSANDIERLQKARHFAQKYFIYIILKGHYSLVACPDGEVYFNPTGNAGMATGGSGDVLTGILAGLLAQQYQPKEACILGMYLHGQAGDLAAAELSEEAMLAGDIVRYLGKAFRSIQTI